MPKIAQTITNEPQTINPSSFNEVKKLFDQVVDNKFENKNEALIDEVKKLASN